MQGHALAAIQRFWVAGRGSSIRLFVYSIMAGLNVSGFVYG